jgi:hypothetical protein
MHPEPTGCVQLRSGHSGLGPQQSSHAWQGHGVEGKG